MIADAYHSRDFATDYMDLSAQRFRVSSFAWHPIYYGFLLAVAIQTGVFLLYSTPLSKRVRNFLLGVLLLLLVNLLLTNSRTPLVALIAGLSFFYFFSVTVKNKLGILAAAFFLFSTVYFIFPQATKIVNDTYDT